MARAWSEADLALRARTKSQPDGQRGHLAPALDHGGMGKIQAAADFAQPQTLAQRLQDSLLARGQVAREQVDDFPGLHLGQHRNFIRRTNQPVPHLLVLRQLDLQAAPFGGIDAAPPVQTMAKMERTTLQIPAQGLTGTFPLDVPPMAERLLHQIFTQERIAGHPVNDSPQVLYGRWLQFPHDRCLLWFHSAVSLECLPSCVTCFCFLHTHPWSNSYQVSKKILVPALTTPNPPPP